MSLFSTSNLSLAIGGLILLTVLLVALIFALSFYRKKKVQETISRLTSGVQEIPAAEFLAMREVREGRKKISNQSDFTGIYIIHNVTKDMYYVGQSKAVLKRVSAHFAGSGNGDVYADLKYGDMFAVRAIPLSGSGYASLDDLKRDAIKVYDACGRGYNKNRGSRARD